MKTTNGLVTDACTLLAGVIALLGCAPNGLAQGTVDPPYVPYASSVSLSHRSSGSNEWVDVTVDLPTPCHYVSTWGTPMRFGTQIPADTAFYSPSVICAQVITPVSHSYNLGTLPGGTYTFTLSAFWQPIKSLSFVVNSGTPYTPPPDDVRLEHRVSGSNEIVEVSVILGDACKRVQSWGTAARSNSTFAADASLRDLGEVCAQVITTVTNLFDLGQLSPGMYEFVFRANGASVKTNRFTVPDSESDSDGDGVSDWDEYLADTDPHDPQSKLCLTRIVRQGSNLRLEWQGGIMATQVLQQASGWGGNGLVWRDVLTNTPPTARTGSFSDLSCTNGTSFLRIRATR